jgi:hypothetical protein
MSLDRYRPWGQSQEKIRPEHRDRAAVVYVRQSSRQQVLEHSESTRLQYALAERAVALGWARSRIVVIDDDLGVSAATADARAGFARLVTMQHTTAYEGGLVYNLPRSNSSINFVFNRNVYTDDATASTWTENRQNLYFSVKF